MCQVTDRPSTDRRIIFNRMVHKRRILIVQGQTHSFGKCWWRHLPHRRCNYRRLRTVAKDVACTEIIWNVKKKVQNTCCAAIVGHTSLQLRTFPHINRGREGSGNLLSFSLISAKARTRDAQMRSYSATH